MLNVYYLSLICQHFFNDTSYFFAWQTILILDLDSQLEALFCRLINFDLCILIILLVVFEFNSHWAVSIIAFEPHHVSCFHEHSAGLSAYMTQSTLYDLPIGRCKSSCFHENLPRCGFFDFFDD